ncbi:MAG TPA: hypothetical protein VFB45_25950 [Pseudolabrys sp.]|nr:hypothetical protein [Pseudolabrys sp.]
MLSQSFYLQQAETCLMLARRTLDPALRRRYAELAIEFSEELEDLPHGDRALAMCHDPAQALALHSLRAKSH